MRQSREGSRALRRSLRRSYALRGYVMLNVLLLLALFTTAQGRAVNISNTWVLPEEGFPVFYRYFRDRISWYEADAVCQFHHANLVTVDTTAQYDAVRAYLKELDISSAVWVGLIRSNPDGDFTWTDYRGLSGDGYWSSAPDTRSAPLCAAADPAADYRWEARACGGPTVASFICELPVPQWALGKEGCMVRALPALTVLYLPESAAVQLTADCGLAGVKRVQCTGNVKRDELLKDLSCNEEEEISTIVMPTVLPGLTSSSVTTFTDQDTSNDFTTDNNITTEHEDDINQYPATIKSSITPHVTIYDSVNNVQQNTLTKMYRVPIVKAVNFDAMHNNNLHSNDIPNPVDDNKLINEESEKTDDEKLMQHKMLHDELARLGNLETIFSQPTDHFVPPLVMAKAKISDDMTSLSVEEKLAQQFVDHSPRHTNEQSINFGTILTDKISETTTQKLHEFVTTENLLIKAMSSKTMEDQVKKDVIKHVPKKYFDKLNDVKSKLLKISPKPTSTERVTLKSQKPYETTLKEIETTTSIFIPNYNGSDEDTLDLTVIIKDPINNLSIISSNQNEDTNETFVRNPPATERIDIEKTSSQPGITSDGTLNHEIITITTFSENVTTEPNFQTRISGIGTKMPVFKDDVDDGSVEDILQKIQSPRSNNNTLVRVSTTKEPITLTEKDSVTVQIIGNSDGNNMTLIDTPLSEISVTSTKETFTTNVEVTAMTQQSTNNNEQHNIESIKSTTIITYAIDKDNNNVLNGTEVYENIDKTFTSTPGTTDDFQSPLLSGASEPLHKPNRSRRPQQANHVNKFNPFRILG